MQDSVIFPAPGGIDRSSLDAAARELGADVVTLTAEDGVGLYAWHYRAQGERALLFLPGNAEAVSGRMTLARQVRRAGYDFVILAYRGYPGSEGRPSEAGLHADARAIWRYLVEEQGFSRERIVVHGRSLGGGVAVRLAAEVQPGALVLESTFLSILELASVSAPTYPVNRLLRHPFRSDLVAGSIRTPTLLMHGTEDQVIPMHHGARLAELIEGAQLVLVDGAGHNTSLTVSSPDARAAYSALLTATAQED
jgi:hypothetical protein